MTNLLYQIHKTNIKMIYKLKMMDKVFDLTPYNVLMERQFAEMRYLNNLPLQDQFETVCKSLQVPEYLTKDLKLLYIYNVRAISLGNDIEVSFVCKNCKKKNILTVDLDIDNIQAETDITLDKYLKLSSRESEQELASKGEIKTIYDLAKLRLQRESELKLKNTEHEMHCIFCGHSKVIRLLDTEFCLDSLFKCRLLDLLKTNRILVKDGFTLSDINEMRPIERDLYIKFLEEEIEQRKQEQKKQGIL